MGPHVSVCLTPPPLAAMFQLPTSGRQSRWKEPAATKSAQSWLQKISNRQPLEIFVVRCSHDFPMISHDVLMESPNNLQKFPQENPDLHQAQGASTGFLLHGLALTEKFFGLALFGRLTKTHSFAGWMNCNKVRIYHIILYMICILYIIYIYIHHIPKRLAFLGREFTEFQKFPPPGAKIGLRSVGAFHGEEINRKCSCQAKQRPHLEPAFHTDSPCCISKLSPKNLNKIQSLTNTRITKCKSFTHLYE